MDTRRTNDSPWIVILKPAILAGGFEPIILFCIIRLCMTGLFLAAHTCTRAIRLCFPLAFDSGQGNKRTNARVSNEVSWRLLRQLV